MTTLIIIVGVINVAYNYISNVGDSFAVGHCSVNDHYCSAYYRYY